MPQSRIMVVIDPTLERDPAFVRGLQTAQLRGAGLHLYTCTCKPPEIGAEESTEAALERFRDTVFARMESMREEAAAAGIACTVEIACADDFREEMVRAAAREGVDLILKNSVSHSRAQRERRSTGDWMLMRLAPCPVLMVKDFHDWSRKRVLGAINLDTTDVAHVKLNNRIIREARLFADRFGSEIHFATAYGDRNREPRAADIAAECGVAPERVHVRHGPAAASILDIAGELDVDLVMIGTVGRMGLMGTVLGNTAERVLDETQADVLVFN